MNKIWRDEKFKLRFTIGEIPLFSIIYDCRVLKNSYFGLPDYSEASYSQEVALLGNLVVRLPSHPVADKLPRIKVSRGRIRYIPSYYHRYFTCLQGSFDDYMGKFSSKTRSTLLRKIKKFKEACGGNLQWREYISPRELEEFHRLARLVSQKTYQERLLHVGLPDTPDFFGEMLKMAAQDLVRGYLLFKHDEPVAYIYCPIQKDTLIYQYVGYDPKYASLSPGTVLQYLVIQHLFHEQKYVRFDFTEGEGSHKRLFATTSKPCADIHYFKLTARNLLLIYAQIAVTDMTSLLAGTLDRFGLKQKAKKLIRRIK